MSGSCPHGMATGIGSLPFTDPDQAVDFVLTHMPRLPHWPQMPRRGIEEYFVFQFLQPLVDTGLLETTDKKFFFDTNQSDWSDRLTEFYTICLAAESGDADALSRFLPPLRGASGFHALIAHLDKSGTDNIDFLKGQIAGPLTVGLNLKDEKGRYAYYQEELRDVIVRTLALNARSQACALSQLGPQSIIFVDEPAISAYGTRDHLTMTREMIMEDMDMIFRSAESENALVGVHACEAIDWSLLLGSKMQILSLDAYRFGNSINYYLPQIKNFLERGGIMAWGIVPTLDDPFEQDPDSLLSLLKALLSRMAEGGLDPEFVIRQSMITPSCGAGLLSVEKSQRIYELAAAISEMIPIQRW